MKKIRADKLQKYKNEDLSVNKKKKHHIYVTVNNLSFSESIKHLKKDGTLILGAAGFSGMLRAGLARISGRNVLTGVIKESTEGINFVRELIDRGEYQPVLDRVFSLDQIAEAHEYVDLGHKKGNVAIQVTP